jgi:hypothetical protein
MKDELLHRLYAILTGEDQNPAFSKIAADDRQAILEILQETLPGLPDYWKTGGVAGRRKTSPTGG